ncbi:MAG: LapA family protein [Candidatus Marinimicrobia bacterium]|nr:LapA family protein [Candidatus Neomarinimicrobiota bacterium]
MKYLKLLVLVFIVLLLLIFVIQNVGQKITLKFFSSNYAFSTEMIVVLLIAMVLGFLIGYLIAGFQILEQRRIVHVLNGEYKKLKKEIDLLRNKDLEEVELKE